MKSAKELIEELSKYESELEISERRVIIETDRLKEGFDDFDWSDVELPPTFFPKWIQDELDDHIPQDARDGDIIPRHVGDFRFLVKYRKINTFDYIVISIKRIKGTQK